MVLHRAPLGPITDRLQVTPSDAPVTEEGAGAVQSESLAAESVNAGGAFSANRDAEPETSQQIASETHKAHASRDEPRDPSSGLRSEDVDAYAGEAPSYASINEIRKQQQGNPKGRDLKEGGFEGEGPGDSIEAEPGSVDDPARDKEQKFGLQDEEGKGGRRGTGQRSATGDGQNVYEDLGGDTAA
jgi:hypothetical protein